MVISNMRAFPPLVPTTAAVGGSVAGAGSNGAGGGSVSGSEAGLEGGSGLSGYSGGELYAVPGAWGGLGGSVPRGTCTDGLEST